MSNWLVSVVVVICNVVGWCMMFAVQEWERTNGRIPSTGILYMQSFWTNGPFGDLLALSCIDVAMAITLSHGGITVLVLSMVVLSGIVVTLAFYMNATKPSRKMGDWGFQKSLSGQWYPTRGGKVHLGYFFLQAGVISLFILFLALGRVGGYALLLGVFGLILYGVAVLLNQPKFKSLGV